MVFTVQGSKDPSHSLSESLRSERQRAKSWMARIELKRAPMKEVAKTIVLFQRGMTEEKRGERKRKRRDEGMETSPLAGRPKRKVILDVITNRLQIARHFVLPRMIPAVHNSSNIPRFSPIRPTPRYSRRSDHNSDRDPLRPHSRLHNLNIVLLINEPSPGFEGTLPFVTSFDILQIIQISVSDSFSRL